MTWRISDPWGSVEAVSDFRWISVRLRIAEPSPIPMRASQFHKPTARNVENGYCQDPHCINEGQTVTVSGWSLGKICDDCPMPDRLMKCERGKDGKNV